MKSRPKSRFFRKRLSRLVLRVGEADKGPGEVLWDKGERF